MENTKLETIDFGTGVLNYTVPQGQSIEVKQLMDALQEAALVVPLSKLINSIKAQTRF